jgi:hypothetical protein
MGVPKWKQNNIIIFPAHLSLSLGNKIISSSLSLSLKLSKQMVGGKHMIAFS